MRFPRAAGVLVHPTSFPSRFGIGDFGEQAYRFIDFLVDSRQSLWQVLPLGPTGYADSPYQCFSAFAGSPLLISPDKLVDDGYLPATAVQSVPYFPTHAVDYGEVIDYKNALYQQAFTHFQEHGSPEQVAAFDKFCADNDFWLSDFALFMAVKNYHKDVSGGVWNTWPEDIAQRQPEAIAAWSHQLADEIAQHKFLQFLFFAQWLALKQYANERGIKVIGDIPIFVAFDSADVWANPDLFFLKEDGSPEFIAGVPPDYFSETGQRWGNPLYRWEKMKASGYAWWVKRLEMTFLQADIVRIDHFRGFEAYWEIPAAEPTAVIGQWVKGPAADFFRAMKDQLGVLPIIAEDLGVITPEVVALRDEFDFPGMKILQFGFGGERNSSFLPHTFDQNCVVYTGTHDNDTVIGWYNSATEEERDHFRRYLAVDGHDVAWDMIRLAFMSVGDTAVATMQDLMRLGTEARMNFPGKVGGYWRWRYTPEMLNGQITHHLRALTEMYGRAPEQELPDV
ncbi:MAG: 4-alpha-glucanotransferase [Ardenticatenaceae bacterium]|nr:4-alpha-glucanotransferase [Ardenticatenaceae bacterium]MCB8986436.1 4-alpha-glucanotransferase [Ardenticatenaceae bacterium]